MSKESRARRRAVAAKPSWLKRNWPWVCVAAVFLIMCGVGVYGWLNRPEALTAKATVIAKQSIGDTATELRDVDSAEVSKLVMVWRVFHAGPQLAPKFAQNKEALIKYLKHQDEMLKVQVELFERFGPERYRCVLESFVGEDGIRDVRRMLSELEPVEKLAAAASSEGARAEEAQQQIAMILQQNPGALSKFTVQGRLALYLAKSKKPNVEQVCFGADLRESKQLGNLTRERLINLVMLENSPTDQDLQGFIDAMRKDLRDDGMKRHRHIAETISRFPPGAVVSVLLGGSHSKYGKRIEKELPDPSVEDEILRIAGIAPHVWEQRDYNWLLDYMQTSSAFVLSPDSSLKEVREIVQKLRDSTKK